MASIFAAWGTAGLEAMEAFSLAEPRKRYEAENLRLAREVQDGWVALHRRLHDPAVPGGNIITERARLLLLQAEWDTLSARLSAEFSAWFERWKADHPKPESDV